MASYKVKLTDHANKDLEVIYQRYVTRVDDQNAAKLLSEIDVAIEQLATKPLLGHLPLELSLFDEDCLELLTKSFRLIYRLANNTVTIIMILHQKQSAVKAVLARLLH